MIRLMADTWQEAVLRPIAMAAPNGWVYTEIMAPDFRFLFALGLAVVLLIAVLSGRWKLDGQRPVWLLLALIFVSFIPWMATTGNGRYFMPYLLLIGPLCIALIRLIPVTGSMKMSVAAIFIGLQGLAVYQNSPWTPFDSWASTSWKNNPYLTIDIDSGAIDPEATYVSISNLSFSFAAPLFPRSSRWVNLSLFNGVDVTNDAGLYKPVRDILGNAKSLKLFQRAQPREMLDETGIPNIKAIAAINSYLQPHRLKVNEPKDCKLLKSRGFSSSNIKLAGESTKERERVLDMSGFWVCSLQYPVGSGSGSGAPAILSDSERRAKMVFEKMEQLCPRFFAPGQNIVGTHPAGHTRAYANSDSSLIITRNGDIYFTYARTLNPQLVARAEDILKTDSTFDCNKFKGRAGLPWEREI